MLDSKTNQEILREIGARLRGYRLQQNVPAADLATRAGMSRTTLLAAEAGENVGMETMLRMLRALGRLDALDAFLPPAMVSPMEMLRRGGSRPRKRARLSRTARKRDAVPGAPVLPPTGMRSIVTGTSPDSTRSESEKER